MRGGGRISFVSTYILLAAQEEEEDVVGSYLDTLLLLLVLSCDEEGVAKPSNPITGQADRQADSHLGCFIIINMWLH